MELSEDWMEKRYRLLQSIKGDEVER